MDPSDEVLMARVSRGDPAALEILYDRHSPLVLGVLLKMLHDRAAAEEALQEAFWRVWTKADTFDASRGSFRPWLLSLARRLAIDDMRRQNIRPQAPGSEAELQQMRTTADPEQRVEEAAGQSLEWERVHDALQALSPEQRQVLELAYLGGLTRQEIADRTGQPLGTVHTRARLGLQRLRAALSAEEE